MERITSFTIDHDVLVPGFYISRKDGDITGTPVKVTWNNGKFFFDTDNAEKTVIIPSTGENRNYVLPTVIGIIAVAIVGVGVFFIKKYVVDRNK